MRIVRLDRATRLGLDGARRHDYYAQHPCLVGKVELRLVFDDAVAVTAVTLSGSRSDTNVLESIAYEVLLACASDELDDPAWTTTHLT